MWQGTLQPELCVAVRLAHGVTGDAARRALRTIIDRAGSESPDTRTLKYLVAHDDLQRSLSAGSGMQFFLRT